MHSYLSKVGFDRNPSKKAGFNEKPRFLLHLKKPEVRPISIGSYSISACAIYTTSALRQDQTKPHGVSFSLSIALVFLSFSYFVSAFCLCFLICIL